MICKLATFAIFCAATQVFFFLASSLVDLDALLLGPYIQKSAFNLQMLIEDEPSHDFWLLYCLYMDCGVLLKLVLYYLLM